ncbi:MAG: hypothetical protein ACI9RM_002357, partial [Ulvibacter sp.]
LLSHDVIEPPASFHGTEWMFNYGLSLCIIFWCFSYVFFVYFKRFGKLMSFNYFLIFGFCTLLFYWAGFPVFSFVLLYSIYSFVIPVTISD